MCSNYMDPVIGSYEPNLDIAVTDADVVMALRIQHERFETDMSLDLDEYKHLYQLTTERISIV